MRRRLLAKVLVGFALAVAVGLTGLYWYLRQSLPLMTGTISVRGLSATVDIVRDADAIPHILAVNKPDALFGLGYVHAQDRLWQMEFQRRIGHGRLSEIFGAAALPEDRFLRTVGFGRAARTAWDRLPADARSDVEAYLAGVNAFIAAHHGRELPPEFSLLRFEPEVWTGPDVLVWVKMMAWDLSANYSVELLKHDLLERVGPARTSQLLPHPEDGLSILNGVGPHPPATSPESSESAAHLPGGRGVTSWANAFAETLSGSRGSLRDLLLGGARTEALGSNNWVVDGTLTASGKPLLANDPHLATHIPSLWYLAHLSGGDFEVIGATLPGAPAVAIGRNRHIAWGETNVAADVQDLYRERLNGTGDGATFKGVTEPLRFIDEEIKVKGDAPVHLKVRLSRHGPLISDAINANYAASDVIVKAPPIEPLAFRWTALDEDDRTLVAFLKLNEARNWGDFTAAMTDFTVPSQNFVYADVDGHIGYYLPGRIPIRAHGDGSQPAEGWTGEMEWTGFIRFAELPHTFDPPEHFIVTANNRPTPASYPYLIGLEYPEPYRAQRITDLLRERAGHGGLTVDDMRRIQSDTYSLHGQTLLPLLLHMVDATDADDQRAVDLLRSWNFDATGDSAAAAIYEAWFLKLIPVIAGDDLGARLLEDYQGRYSYVTRFLTTTLTRNDAAWCDDATTPVKETCRQSVTKALHESVTALRAVLGADMRGWRWSTAHRVVFPHQGLDAVAPLRPLLGRSVAGAGDFSTVNVGAVAADHPYEQRAIPGYRQIIDLSPRNDSRFLDAVGQSGHFLSPHYDDFLKDWQVVAHKPMRMERPDIEAGSVGTLRLTPSR
jgi:penicillin amidase